MVLLLLLLQLLVLLAVGRVKSIASGRDRASSTAAIDSCNVRSNVVAVMLAKQSQTLSVALATSRCT